MYGIGMFNAYGSYILEQWGGTNASLVVAVGIRVLVGVCWYFMFRRAGLKGHYAFIPFIGPYTAFKMVWDDFSLAAIFAGTTFVAMVDAVGVQHSIIHGCAIINFVMWWIMALLTAYAFQANILMGCLYGGVPWLGGFLFATWPSLKYRGAWLTDPEAEQNLSSKERKKRRKKAEREANAASKE